jgi:hypothetical protein
MNDNVKLKLPGLAIGQILDALYLRMEAWEYTEEYLNTVQVHEPYCVEECSSAYEARRIADYYKEIIQSIEKQAGFPSR